MRLRRGLKKQGLGTPGVRDDFFHAGPCRLVAEAGAYEIQQGCDLRVVKGRGKSRHDRTALALYRGVAVGLIGTKAISGLPQSWRDLANKHIGTSSYPLIVVPIVVLALLFAVLLHFTPFGRGVYEIGLNAETAHFSGVDVRRSKLLLYVLSGVVSAFAGVFYLLRFDSANTDTGTGLELQVIAAVLLGGVSIFGGRGDLLGVLAGVLLIGVLSSALRLQQTGSDVIEIVIGVLLVLSVISTQLLDRLRALRARTRRTERSASAPEVGDESRKVKS